MKCMENPPRLGARGFKGRYTDRGLEKTRKLSCKMVWLVTHPIPNRNKHLLLPLRPPLLEAVFFVDAVPHPPCRGALVASVPLWVQQQVHVLRSRGALICQEQQEDRSVSLLTYMSLPAHTAAWLTPVTALDPEFVQLGQVTQERKEQLLPFFGISKFTQVMQHSLP